MYNSKINIDVVLLSHSRPYLYFIICSKSIFITKSVFPYSDSKSSSASQIAFSCHACFNQSYFVSHLDDFEEYR